MNPEFPRAVAAYMFQYKIAEDDAEMAVQILIVLNFEAAVWGWEAVW